MRWLARLGVGAVVLVGLLAALWGASYVRGPTAAQRAALASLQAPDGFQGRNAFDAIWLLAHDVPDAALASVADADIAAFAAVPTLRLFDDDSSARHRYADLRPGRGTHVAPCTVAGPPCLEVVREDPLAYAALVDANHRLIRRVEALAQYGHIASRMPVRIDAPVPAYQHLVWPLTAHAVAFARGERSAALDATCRDMATMRRLGPRTDQLMSTMLISRLVTDGYGRLLADMLSELPSGTPLPDSCTAAVGAPSRLEASVCPALRGEFRLARSAVASMGGDGPAEPWAWLVFDAQGHAAMTAQRIGAGCSDAAADALREDRRFASDPARPLHRRFECVANSGGCLLADTSATLYDDHVRAGQDHHARLQVIGTLAWLHAQPAAGTLAERLGRRPAGLRSPARDVTVSADGRALQIAQYADRHGDTWSLPLPPYLVASTGPAD